MNKKSSAISWTESIWHTKSSHNFFNKIYTAYAFYVFLLLRISKFKLYSASFLGFYVVLLVLFGFSFYLLPPPKKKLIPSTAPNQKPLCFRHPYNRVLHQSPGKLFLRLGVGPMFLFRHETKIQRQKNKINGFCMHWHIPNDPNVWNIDNLHVLDIEAYKWTSGIYLIAILESLLKLKFSGLLKLIPSYSTTKAFGDQRILAFQGGPLPVIDGAIITYVKWPYKRVTGAMSPL